MGDQETFPLPSNGWTPDGPMMAARLDGAFHAEMTDDGPEAWMGSTRRPTTWPQGFRVRFDPTVLVNPDGEVVAHGGDVLTSGGGFSPDGVLLVQGWPMRAPDGNERRSR